MMKSFVQCPEDSDFPIQNLPYGVFTSPANEEKHIGVAIGEHILDLHVVAHLLPADLQHVFKERSLNALMGLERAQWVAAREAIQGLLRDDNPRLRDDADLRARALVAQRSAAMHLPAAIGDYSDFYSSIQHATNVGVMFRGKERALLDNWRHLPVGYHGRASSVVVSGTPVTRPLGQTLPAEGAAPVFGPSRLMDFELEVACFVGGPPTALGTRVTAAQATDRIFGFVLMNDWSARDIQKWEYVPLGPFTAKNLGTSISPWVVTAEALRPYAVPNWPQEPPPFPYLRHDDPFNFDIHLEVDLLPEGAAQATTVCRSNYRHLYWTAKQQLAQQTVTGCSINPGDLLGSGTISGETPESFGSMLELSWKGSRPVALREGGERRFLHDGDTVTLRGYCAPRAGAPRIGFGLCSGKLLPATPL